MEEEHNRQELAHAVAAWNRGQLENYLALYSEHVHHHGIAAEPLDAAANRAWYEALWAAFPGVHLSLDETVAERSMLSVRFHLHGEHRGEFMGLAATGRPFVMAGQTTMRFLDARVVERWTVADVYGLLVQLGAIPRPAA